MKSSFSRSSSVSRSLARRSSAPAASSACDFSSSAAVDLDHARGLVEDEHDLVDAERLFLHHRAHQDPRRGRADGAREQALGIKHQLGIGFEGGGVAAAPARPGGEHLLRAADARGSVRPRPEIGEAARCGATNCAALALSKASTKSAACARSTADCRPNSETPMSSATLTRSDQKVLCVTGSSRRGRTAHRG